MVLWEQQPLVPPAQALLGPLLVHGSASHLECGTDLWPHFQVGGRERAQPWELLTCNGELRLGLNNTRLGLGVDHFWEELVMWDDA